MATLPMRPDGATLLPPAVVHGPSYRPPASEAPAVHAPVARGERLLSLDAFRGIVIALMVLVNNPGTQTGAFPLLRHVRWDGWTLTETIAPAFLWVVGVAIALTEGTGPGDPTRARPIGRVLRRAAVLFGLGVLIMATPRPIPIPDLHALATLRIPGTLQRIALCYLAATLLHRIAGPRGLVAWAVVLVAGYWALLRLVPVPGFGPSVLTVDGYNLHAYVDHVLLGAHAKRFDPLGVLSTLSAIGTTLLGVATGALLRRGDPAGTVRRLALLAAGLLVGGQLLARWIPINESLWSPSFVVFMAGVATAGFALCHWAVAVRRWSRWTRPFVIYGVNTLAVFVLSQMLANFVAGVGVPALGRDWVSLRSLVFTAVYERVAPTHIASLLYALTWVLGFYVLAWVMYRKRWILRA